MVGEGGAEERRKRGGGENGEGRERVGGWGNLARKTVTRPPAAAYVALGRRRGMARVTACACVGHARGRGWLKWGRM